MVTLSPSSAPCFPTESSCRSGAGVTWLVLANGPWSEETCQLGARTVVTAPLAPFLICVALGATESVTARGRGPHLRAEGQAPRSHQGLTGFSDVEANFNYLLTPRTDHMDSSLILTFTGR